MTFMRSFVLLLLVIYALPSVAANAPSQIKAMSFVALSESKLPNPSALRESLQRRIGATKIDEMETDDKQVILFRTRGGTISVGLLDRPLPKDEIDHMCKFAWYWKAACEVMATHKAHLLVMILGTDLDKIGAALLQTNVVAALLDANAVASYWGTNLQPKDAFLKQSAQASRQSLPVLLWVNFRLSSEANKGWTISTDGMAAFDLYEIECKGAQTDGKSLVILIAGMAEYLISKGPIIKDGETIGDSPALNIRVKHAPSYWRENMMVYRVIFPNK